MPSDDLPLFEKDPDQSGVRDGYTRYIIRTWGKIHYGTFVRIFLNEAGDPELHSSGLNQHDDSDDGWTGSARADYPDQVSYIYLEPGGSIDPRVLRLRAGPPPKELSKPRRPPFPMSIQSLPTELKRLYQAPAESIKARQFEKARDESEVLLRRFAVLKGAPEDERLDFYLAFMRKENLIPHYATADWLQRALESDLETVTAGFISVAGRPLPDPMQLFATTLYAFCTQVLWFAYECGGVHKPRWSSFDDASE